MSDSFAPRERQVIIIPGGKADPNQLYERMRVFTEEGEEWTPPSPEIPPPADPVPTAAPSIASAIGAGFTLIDADKPVNLTVSGQAKGNATPDPGRVVLYISDDDGATGTKVAQFDVLSSAFVPYTLSGIVPAGWKAIIAWEQDAAGAGGTLGSTAVVVQPLA